MNRRNFLELVAAAAGSQLSPAYGQVCSVKSGTVRDRLWVFCNPVNADYNMVEKRSVMTPVESALYLGVPNIMMVNQYPGPGQQPDQDRFYQAWRSPFELYAYPTRMLKRVVWSVVGASGKTNPSERSEVMAMARRTPNIVGITMDDFFNDKGGASLTPAQLQEIQHELKQPEKKLDLYVTLYTRQLNESVVEYLKLIDVITLWTWESDDLVNLEANLRKLEQIAPHSRKILGCYTAALNPATPRWIPLPVPAMRRQCETGLRWLREGRIEGIMIYGNFLDLGWDAVDWTHDWIERVGDTAL